MFKTSIVVITLLLTSRCVGEDSHFMHLEGDEDCPRQKVDFLLILLKILSSCQVVLVYDHHCEVLYNHILETFEKENLGVKVQNVDVSGMDSNGSRDSLLKLWNEDSVNEIILLLSNKTKEFLRIANSLDFKSRKATNFRTASKWIVWNLGGLHTINIQFELKNVLIINSRNDYKNISTVVSQNITQTVYCFICNQTCSKTDLYPNINYKLNGRHLWIGTMAGTAIRQESGKSNQTVFRGVLADFVSDIAQLLNFTFTFAIPSDLRYGSKTANGSWNGMVGQLERQEVDMVVAELTITNERMEVVDFVLPAFLYQNLGVLYRKNTKEGSNWTKVFGPLHANVYYCVTGSILVVGIFLYFIDVDFDHNSSFKSTGKRSILKFLISVTSLIGFISRNGNGLWPRKDSARMLVTFLWFFSLVITATYVGNLTAKLTTENKPFKSMEEMASLPDWTWGVNGGGLTQSILQSSRDSVFIKLWKSIVELNKTDPDVLIWNTEKQLNRVLYSGQKYAYIVIDPKYFAYNSDHCQIEMVDTVISSLGLAIAITKNSYLKRPLETTMWSFSSNGILQKLENNWYKDKRPKRCRSSKTNRPMQILDMLGLLWIIGIGMVLSIIVLSVEMFIRQLRLRRR